MYLDLDRPSGQPETRRPRVEIGSGYGFGLVCRRTSNDPGPKSIRVMVLDRFASGSVDPNDPGLSLFFCSSLFKILKYTLTRSQT